MRLTEQNAHLEAENVDIESLLFDPLLFVHNVDEDAPVYNEACVKHDHEVVAHAYGRLGAAVGVDRDRIVKEAHRRVHLLLLGDRIGVQEIDLKGLCSGGCGSREVQQRSFQEG